MAFTIEESSWALDNASRAFADNGSVVPAVLVAVVVVTAAVAAITVAVEFADGDGGLTDEAEFIIGTTKVVVWPSNT